MGFVSFEPIFNLLKKAVFEKLSIPFISFIWINI